MLIRGWLSGDNERIALLEKECFSDPWSYGMICDTSQASNFLGLVAEIEGEVVGYLGSAFVLDEGEILLVAVDGRYRRRGIGEALVNKMTEDLKEKGVLKLFLEVRRSNQSAYNCYEKCKFTPIGVRKGYYSNGEDAIVMERSL